MSTQVAHNDTRKSVVALVMSLTPLYFLSTNRSSLGLDRLHIGLLQCLLLLLLRAGLDLLPSREPRLKPAAAATKRSSSPPPVIVVEKSAVKPVTTPTTAEASKKRRTRHDAAKAKKPRLPRSHHHLAGPTPVVVAPPPPFSATKLDETVANFVSITDPAFLAYLPGVKPTTTIPPAPLTAWTTTYSAGDIEVVQHPTLKSLFGICATYPDVPLRALYEVLTNVNERARWDSMTQGAEEVEKFEAGGKKANCMHMKMKGMAMVKAKDLVLLSVSGTLPTSHSSPLSAPITPTLPLAPKLRVFAATTSVDHPRYPPTPDFNRMELAVSGFMIEEANEGKGSRIVQITDLSGLGSWIPSAVIRTITQTLLPKSLIKLGAASAAAAAEGPNDEILFPPAVLGSAPPPSIAPVAPTGAGAAGEKEKTASLLSGRSGSLASDLEDGDESDTESDDSASSIAPSLSSTAPSSLDDTGSKPALLAPSTSRDLHALLTQLRSLTTRLSALESLVAISQSAAAGGRRAWYLPFSSSSSSPSPKKKPGVKAGAETAQLSEGRLSALFTLGSAAGAAIAVAAVAAWGRRGMQR
ncbi:hypothetical protein JCM6882_000783 [Rhodosporidiobolus microsporus]